MLGSLCCLHTCIVRASQVLLVVKNSPANAGDIRDTGLIPGLGRSPRGGFSNPLQFSCLENPTNRGAWLATVHGVAKSWTQLKWLSMQKSSWVNLQLWFPQHIRYYTAFESQCLLLGITKFVLNFFLPLFLIKFGDRPWLGSSQGSGSPRIAIVQYEVTGTAPLIWETPHKDPDRKQLAIF